MPAASYRSQPGRRRPTSLVLAILAHLLIIWLLLRVAPTPTLPLTTATRTTTFQMLPDAAQEAPSAAAHPRAATQQASAAAHPVVPPPPPPVLPPHTVPLPQTPAEPAPTSPSPFGDKALADFDLNNLPHGTAGAGAASGKGSAAVYGPGEGPGGESLANADWYREPTHAELATYLPPNVAEGSWGMVACRTAERYHVENCRQIGEEPEGSGLSRALRQAAWQFLVVPPRKDGKPIIGAWVRIRVDFTAAGATIR